MLTFEYSTANRDMPVAYGSFRAMHTLCEVLIAGIARPAAEELIRRIYERAGVLESKFNRFDPQSGVSRMNRSAACGETTVDDELYGALEMCRVFNRSTCGSFDIAVQSEERPSGEAYLLQPSHHAVRFTGTGVTLDFGGFAKGYALERIKQLLIKETAGSALVNFGNSSILALGVHPFGDHWPVGLANPFRDGEEAYGFKLRDGALSISGHTPEHPRHIIDPGSGGYVARDGFVAVQGRSPLVAEVLSTALFAAPETKWSGIMENYTDYRAVRIGCDRDGTVTVTEIT